MRLHEALARTGKGARIAGFQAFLRGISGKPATIHGVVNALTRSGGDHAGGVPGQDHIAAIIPALQRLQRNRRTFAANCLGIRQANIAAEFSNRTTQRKALLHGTRADAGRVAMREDPGVEIGRKLALIIDIAALGIEIRPPAIRR